MKKSLLALAVLGSIAGSAVAQSSVTVYGVIDASISRADTDGSNNEVWGLDSGSWSGSRIGFKGNEDLGGGLSAIFVLENGFGVDNGALGQGNRLFGRQAWVGLESKTIGAVKLGRQYAPIHLAIDSIDPFETGMTGNTENFFFGGTFEGITANGGDVRIDNALSYTTPSALGGFGAQVVYGFGETAGSMGRGQQIGASAEYAAGPVRGVVALHNAKSATGALDQETYFLGGTYDFRVVKLHAGYQTTKLEDAADDSARVRNAVVGVTAPVGAGVVRASWVRADIKDTDVKANQYAIGYSHSLSKRTTLYTSYAHIKAEEGSDDVKANNVQVGVRHLF